MNKLLHRIVAFLVIPCLLADPRWAFAFSSSPAWRTASSRSDRAIFQEEAVVPYLPDFLRPPFQRVKIEEFKTVITILSPDVLRQNPFIGPGSPSVLEEPDQKLDSAKWLVSQKHFKEAIPVFREAIKVYEDALKDDALPVGSELRPIAQAHLSEAQQYQGLLNDFTGMEKSLPGGWKTDPIIEAAKAIWAGVLLDPVLRSLDPRLLISPSPELGKSKIFGLHIRLGKQQKPSETVNFVIEPAGSSMWVWFPREGKLALKFDRRQDVLPYVLAEARAKLLAVLTAPEQTPEKGGVSVPATQPVATEPAQEIAAVPVPEEVSKVLEIDYSHTPYKEAANDIAKHALDQIKVQSDAYQKKTVIAYIRPLPRWERYLYYLGLKGTLLKDSLPWKYIYPRGSPLAYIEDLRSQLRRNAPAGYDFDVQWPHFDTQAVVSLVVLITPPRESKDEITSDIPRSIGIPIVACLTAGLAVYLALHPFAFLMVQEWINVTQLIYLAISVLVVGGVVIHEGWGHRGFQEMVFRLQQNEQYKESLSRIKQKLKNDQISNDDKRQLVSLLVAWEAKIKSVLRIIGASLWDIIRMRGPSQHEATPENYRRAPWQTFWVGLITAFVAALIYIWQTQAVKILNSLFLRDLIAWGVLLVFSAAIDFTNLPWTDVGKARRLEKARKDLKKARPKNIPLPVADFHEHGVETVDRTGQAFDGPDAIAELKLTDQTIVDALNRIYSNLWKDPERQKQKWPLKATYYSVVIPAPPELLAEARRRKEKPVEPVVGMRVSISLGDEKKPEPVHIILSKDTRPASPNPYSLQVYFPGMMPLEKIYLQDPDKLIDFVERNLPSLTKISLFIYSLSLRDMPLSSRGPTQVQKVPTSSVEPIPAPLQGGEETPSVGEKTEKPVTPAQLLPETPAPQSEEAPPTPVQMGETLVLQDLARFLNVEPTKFVKSLTQGEEAITIDDWVDGHPPFRKLLNKMVHEYFDSGRIVCLTVGEGRVALVRGRRTLIFERQAPEKVKEEKTQKLNVNSAWSYSEAGRVNSTELSEEELAKYRFDAFGTLKKLQMGLSPKGHEILKTDYLIAPNKRIQTEAEFNQDNPVPAPVVPVPEVTPEVKKSPPVKGSQVAAVATRTKKPKKVEPKGVGPTSEPRSNETTVPKQAVTPPAHSAPVSIAPTQPAGTAFSSPPNKLPAALIGVGSVAIDTKHEDNNFTSSARQIAVDVWNDVFTQELPQIKFRSKTLIKSITGLPKRSLRDWLGSSWSYLMGLGHDLVNEAAKSGVYATAKHDHNTIRAMQPIQTPKYPEKHFMFHIVYPLWSPTAFIYLSVKNNWGYKKPVETRPAAPPPLASETDAQRYQFTPLELSPKFGENGLYPPAAEAAVGLFEHIIHDVSEDARMDIDKGNKVLVASIDSMRLSTDDLRVYMLGLVASLGNQIRSSEDTRGNNIDLIYGGKTFPYHPEYATEPGIYEFSFEPDPSAHKIGVYLVHRDMAPKTAEPLPSQEEQSRARDLSSAA